MKNGLLSDLLSPAFQNASRIASMLEEHYSTFNEIAEADIDFLSKTLSDTSPAFYIKIAASLVSRRGCDRFKFGKKHTVPVSMEDKLSGKVTLIKVEPSDSPKIRVPRNTKPSGRITSSIFLHALKT